MAETHQHTTVETPPIDEGMRKWYVSCRCCLSDAYPSVVATLDAERDAKKEEHSAAGICEVAEGSAGPSDQMEEVKTMATMILDPVCDMIVDVEKQRASGLVSELLGKTYAFCGPGCKRAFDKDPGKFTAKVSAWEASGSPGEHSHDGHGH